MFKKSRILPNITPPPPPPPSRSTMEVIKEDKMWGEIRRMAKTDPGMSDLVNRVLVYYQLKKEPK